MARLLLVAVAFVAGLAEQLCEESANAQLVSLRAEVHSHVLMDDINRVNKLKLQMLVASKKCQIRLGFCLGSVLINVYNGECTCDKVTALTQTRAVQNSTDDSDDGDAQDTVPQCNKCKDVPLCEVNSECDELSDLAKKMVSNTDSLVEGNWSAFEWPTKEKALQSCIFKYANSAAILAQLKKAAILDMGPALTLQFSLEGCYGLLKQVEMVAGPTSALWALKATTTAADPSTTTAAPITTN